MSDMTKLETATSDDNPAATDQMTKIGNLNNEILLDLGRVLVKLGKRKDVLDQPLIALLQVVRGCKNELAIAQLAIQSPTWPLPVMVASKERSRLYSNGKKRLAYWLMQRHAELYTELATKEGD
jgi:hypothetical protein